MPVHAHIFSGILTSSTKLLVTSQFDTRVQFNLVDVKTAFQRIASGPFAYAHQYCVIFVTLNNNNYCICVLVRDRFGVDGKYRR